MCNQNQVAYENYKTSLLSDQRIMFIDFTFRVQVIYFRK